MRLRVLRGTQEVGGSCIELEAKGARILLDLGLPLDNRDLDPLALLPDIPGLRAEDPTLLGLIISHGHLDHWGLAVHARPELPIFIGEATRRILAAAAPFVPGPKLCSADPRPIHDRQPITVGPFRITPYLVDHSAFDAYAFLIEAEGARVFYSGDLRVHGRKAALVERVMVEPPRPVDALILEGTSIGRPQADKYPTERDIEDRLVIEFQDTTGLPLVFSSSQNIDRVVSVFRAAQRVGRTLILDLYTAEVLRATGRPSIPQGTWPSIRVFMPEWQRRLVARKELFNVLATYRSNRIYPEELAGAAPESVLLFRGSMRQDLEQANALRGARLVWSMWEGYKADPRFASVLAWADAHGIPVASLHTSGHASVSDLKRFVAALNPRRVIPIHTAEPALYARLLPDVHRLADGEALDLAGPPSHTVEESALA